ncbi:hypothetical protein IMSAGC014_01358 [Bacteroidaceae bacterium]|nr:hypothetical protein IMSAGC014_01358 [Bacteroidaceae bacterium]
MAEQGALTGHVGTGDDDDLLLFRVEVYVVGYILLARRHEGFDDGVAALADVELETFVHYGSYVAAFCGDGGQRQEAVQRGQCVGIALKQGYELSGGGYEFVVEAVFKDQDAVFGTEYFFFVFLEFLCDVAFGLREGLFAYPLCRHVFLVGVAHFYVVAENVVEAYLEARYAGGFAFALLYFQEIVLA